MDNVLNWQVKKIEKWMKNLPDCFNVTHVKSESPYLSQEHQHFNCTMSFNKKLKKKRTFFISPESVRFSEVPLLD